MWPFKTKKVIDQKIVKEDIGPFDLKPGESKEFEVRMPIPEGMNPEEALKIVRNKE